VAQTLKEYNMAEPKRRNRPKGSELRESLKSNPEQAYRRARRRKELGALGTTGALGATTAADMVGSTDPYLSRNEFKPGFYDQASKPPITPATMYGTASGKTTFEPNIVDPDTKMIQDTLGMSEGGSAGQYAVQVKKVPFKGVF
jgi:hypothetical protein